MTQFGYTAMCEQTPPRQIVVDMVAAELAGFDFSVISDHYSPWIEEQGHAPNAWPVLGAAAQATRNLPLMTFATCPTFRYHPAVVAQQAATVAALSMGRFTLGLGAGENLNEHVIGSGWPMPEVRQERLAEATEIIRALLTGDYVTYSGKYYRVDRARLYDLPPQPVPIGIAVRGTDGVRLAAREADCLISVEPEAGLVDRFNDAGGHVKPKYGQLTVCYDRDEAAARKRARELWRWSMSGCRVTSELPDPRAFEAESCRVTEADIAAVMPCGPDLELYVSAARRYANAGFTHLALVQVGSQSQEDFLTWAQSELLPVLRERA